MSCFAFKDKCTIVQQLDDKVYSCECRFGHNFMHNIDDDNWCGVCETEEYRQSVIDDHNKRFASIGVDYRIFDMDKFGKAQTICDSNHVDKHDIDDMPIECSKCEVKNITESVLNMRDTSENDNSQTYSDDWSSEGANTDYNTDDVEEMDSWLCEQEDQEEDQEENQEENIWGLSQEESQEEEEKWRGEEESGEFMLFKMDKTDGLRNNTVLLNEAGKYVNFIIQKKENHDINLAFEHSLNLII